MSFKFIDNSDKILKEFADKKKRGLQAIGERAVSYAKDNTPVITSRLKNSENYQLNGDDAYIGTNVEYAKYVEYGHHSYQGKHFLRDAAANHVNEYKDILKKSFEA